MPSFLFYLEAGPLASSTPGQAVPELSPQASGVVGEILWGEGSISAPAHGQKHGKGYFPTEPLRETDLWNKQSALALGFYRIEKIRRVENRDPGYPECGVFRRQIAFFPDPDA